MSGVDVWTGERFREILTAVRAAGYGDDIEWAEAVKGPESAEDFASEAIYVICNSGMRFTVARQIYDRVMLALAASQSSSSCFGHAGKTGAIDHIWQERKNLFEQFQVAPDKVEFCVSLPWIGDITKYHLAKNFGVDVAKPDVHLQRLAAEAGVDAQQLCEGLAEQTGFRVNTIDVVLWRACAIGIIRSRELGQGTLL